MNTSREKKKGKSEKGWSEQSSCLSYPYQKEKKEKKRGGRCQRMKGKGAS